MYVDTWEREVGDITAQKVGPELFWSELGGQHQQRSNLSHNWASVPASGYGLVRWWIDFSVPASLLVQVCTTHTSSPSIERAVGTMYIHTLPSPLFFHIPFSFLPPPFPHLLSYLSPSLLSCSPCLTSLSLLPQFLPPLFPFVASPRHLKLHYNSTLQFTWPQVLNRLNSHDLQL